jgi:hypothetical protein
MLDKLRDFVVWLLPTRTERGSERDGFLSTSREWHALWNGFFKGFYKGGLSRRLLIGDAEPDEFPSPEGSDSRKEREYWRYGFWSGDVVKVLALLWLARQGYVALV